MEKKKSNDKFYMLCFSLQLCQKPECLSVAIVSVENMERISVGVMCYSHLRSIILFHE